MCSLLLHIAFICYGWIIDQTVYITAEREKGQPQQDRYKNQLHISYNKFQFQQRKTHTKKVLLVVEPLREGGSPKFENYLTIRSTNFYFYRYHTYFFSLKHVTVGAELKPELLEIMGSEDSCCITLKSCISLLSCKKKFSPCDLSILISVLYYINVLMQNNFTKHRLVQIYNRVLKSQNKNQT